jgi:hypothetical protein
LDSTGNFSTTNSVSMDYVVTNRLTVIATGQGTLSPNYSNAWLEIGRNYSMTAAPTNGHAFTSWVISTNWMGGATTSNAALQFMMQSNLTLQVNFVDVQRPTNTITAPTAGQRLSNALAQVKGTASDNVRVSAVWYQLNGANWGMGWSTNSWTNWMTTLPLVNGTNVLKAYAVDNAGNKSVTNSVSFISSNTFKLQLGIGSPQPMSSNGLLVDVEVSLKLSCRIEVTTNLVDWEPLSNFVSTNAVMHIRDAAATHHGRRFYRAVTP